jgi:hypothetical protein
MAAFEYHVALIDYRGRISADGQETQIGNERRTAFVRRYLNSLGSEGWEMVGIQPLTEHTAYYVFKREGRASAETEASQNEAATASSPSPEYAGETAPLGTM